MIFRTLTPLLLGAWLLSASEPASSIGAAQALDNLMAGNQRYAEKVMQHPHQSVERRAELAKGQQPFAVVLGCSDSRVPPEVVFDQGLGDLFTVRVAGNVPSDEVIASVEYAIEHLGSKLIVVLGHERCGAVAAAVEGGAPEGHLGSLMHRIQPSVDAAKKMGGDVLDSAVRFNAQRSVAELQSASPILAAAIRSGKVRIVAARYDLDSGKVELLP